MVVDGLGLRPIVLTMRNGCNCEDCTWRHFYRELTCTEPCIIEQVLVEHGKKVTGFLILLRGSARIMEVSKVCSYAS